MSDKEAEIARLEQEASRLSGIPVEVLHEMTEQEMMDEFVGEPDSPPEKGTYSCKFGRAQGRKGTRWTGGLS